jgi:hypothetical protein
MDLRRRCQAAADAAALAAAIDLYANYQTNKGLDPNGTAQASGVAIAKANFKDLPNVTPIVAVHIPPGTGPFAGKAGYAEAFVQVNQQPGFGRIWGSGSIPVSARAVATGRLVPLNDGIIVLDPSSPGALNLVGNATIDVTSGSIIVDSSNAAGATFKGNGSITAPTLDLSGNPGYSTSGGNVTLNTTIQSGQPPVTDPLSWLPVPNPSSLPLQSNSTYKISGKSAVTLSPGLYKGGIIITGQANVTLNPGIYYMQGGGFSDSGQGSLTGNGVMIYDDGSGISVSGNGQVVLSPMTSGQYQGVTLFESRSAGAAGITLVGNGNMSNGGISGAVYAASSSVTIKGNGTADNIGSEYISFDLTLTGNGTIDTTVESAPRPLVRVFGLVE